MPYSALILTAGISAFAPRNTLGSIFRKDGSPLAFEKTKQNPEPANASLDARGLGLACEDWLARHLPNALEPRHVSAEFSLLHQLREAGNLAPGTVVHLIHTPTLAGRLAVILQRSILESNLGIQCYACELPVPFDPSQTGGLALASGSFIGVVSRLLMGHDRWTTAFAPIGGYKAMVALGHIAASLHGFPSLYLHEDSQVLQEIAPAPISLSPEVRKEISAVARHVGNGAEWPSLSAEDQTRIGQHNAFFTRVADLVELNELGQYLRLDSLPILLSPEAEKERKRNPRLIDGQIRQISTLALQNVTHPGINHDLVGTHGRIHPWRLAQMGEFVRIAWQLIPDALLVGKVWRDHDDYDKEVAGFVVGSLPADHSSFTPLP